MNDKNQPFEVYIKNGYVWVEQRDSRRTDSIFIPPNSIDTLVNWLIEAKEEIAKINLDKE